MAGPYTETRLCEAIKAARARAQAVGPLHAAWDAIFDAEALLAGSPILLQGSTEQLMRILTDTLEMD